MNLENGTGFKNNILEKRDALKNRLTELKNHTPSVKKKIGIAFVLGTTVLGVNWGIVPFVAAKNYEAMPDWNIGIVLGVSWGFNIASTLINMNQQRRLLERFGLDQDWMQTAAFHALNKLKPLKKRDTIKSITAVSLPTAIVNLATAGVKEYFTFSVANNLLSSGGTEGVAMLKALQGVSNLTQAGVSEIILRIAGKEKKKDQNLPSSGEIVNLKQKS